MTMKTLAAASLIMLLAAGAFASKELPVSHATETEPYASADLAAVAALRLAMPLSDTYEHGGAVYQRGVSFYYTDAVSNDDTGHIRFDADVPPGARLAAIYHTHPGGGEDGRLFSWGDVKEARELGVLSYIGVLEDGTIRRFDPRRTPTHSYVAPGTVFSPGKVSDGEIVARVLSI